MSAPNGLYHDLMDHLRTVTALALSSAPLTPFYPFG